LFQGGVLPPTGWLDKPLMVQSSKEALGTTQLEEVFEKSKTFANKVNERLVELELDGHFVMDSELKTSRVARKKRMPGEEAPDSRPNSPLQRFRVEVFRRVIDQICTSISERFSVNQELIKDTACLDPRRFKELIDHGIPGEALKISKLTGLNECDLRGELLMLRFAAMITCRRRYRKSIQTTPTQFYRMTMMTRVKVDRKGKKKMKNLARKWNLVPGFVQGPAGVASHAATRFFTVTH